MVNSPMVDSPWSIAESPWSMFHGPQTTGYWTMDLTSLRDGDFDRSVRAARWMLDVDPGPPFVSWIEVESRELGPHCAVRCPSADSFTRIEHIAVLVQISREPDVVVDAAVAVFDDIDVAVMVDGEIVRAG